MSEHSLSAKGPHQGQSLLVAGKALNGAKTAMILLHGRGSTAQTMLSLADELSHPGFVYVAPQAADYTWYPQRFMGPIESNQPHLSSALAAIDDTLAKLQEAGIPPERTILLGFSQGACLALEYAARHAQRYAGVVGLSGGLIGPDSTPRDYPGSLGGTPVFLECSDTDFHIPKGRVLDTAQVMRRLDGEVIMKFYPDLGHTINQDELDFVKKMMTALEVME